MMREGKPELYFLLILYQKFFDLSNPNFGNMELCGVPPCGQTRLGGRYVVAFSGKSRYGEQSLDAQEKLRIALGCGNSVRGVRPRPAENPHLLVYHISVNLSIPKKKKKEEDISPLHIRKGRASWGLRYRPHQPNNYIQRTSFFSTPLIILFERIMPSLPKLPSLCKCLLTNSIK